MCLCNLIKRIFISYLLFARLQNNMTVAASASCSYQLNDNELHYLSLLVDIMKSQKWRAFERAILKNPYSFQAFCRKVQHASELNGMTM